MNIHPDAIREASRGRPDVTLISAFVSGMDRMAAARAEKSAPKKTI